VVDDVVPVGDLKVGDVITYTPPTGEHLITHRIAWIGRDPAGRRIFRTRGDANPIADPRTFTLDRRAQARVRLGVPNAGYALLALGRRDVRLALIAFPAVNDTILPASVIAGWNGSSKAIVVKLVDRGSNDEMDFYDASGNTRLNLTATAADLKLGGNFVSSAATFNATMAQSADNITITLGTQTGGGALPTAAAGTMTWKASANATDAAGHPSGTGTLTESGGLDVDF
jgi:hypothetical protein